MTDSVEFFTPFSHPCKCYLPAARSTLELVIVEIRVSDCVNEYIASMPRPEERLLGNGVSARVLNPIYTSRCADAVCDMRGPYWVTNLFLCCIPTRYLLGTQGYTRVLRTIINLDYDLLMAQMTSSFIGTCHFITIPTPY